MSSHLQSYRKCRGRLKSQLTDPVKVDKDSKCMFDLCTAVLQILTLFLMQFFVFFIKVAYYFNVLVSDEKFLFSDFSVAWLHVRRQTHQPVFFEFCLFSCRDVMINCVILDYLVTGNPV